MQRQTRSMSRGKRGLDSSESEEGQPEKKRPALASVIVEPVMVDSLEKLCSSLVPILRRVVSEEVERALAKLGPSKLGGRSSPKRLEGSDERNLQDYKKHYPPALNDEVWRLEKIRKDGQFHKRLTESGICTVEDFLRLVVRDSQKLRTILGGYMTNTRWEILIEHAKTCALSGKLYVFYDDEARSIGVVFNNIYELSGLIADGQYYPADSLSDSQNIHVDSLLKKAYDNWMHIIEYDDGETLLGLNQNEHLVASQLEVSSSQQDSPPASYDHHQQGSLTCLPVPGWWLKIKAVLEWFLY